MLPAGLIPQRLRRLLFITLALGALLDLGPGTLCG